MMKVVKIILSLMGIAFLAGIFFSTKSTINFQANSATVEATLLRVDKRHVRSSSANAKGGTVQYLPIFGYTVNGKYYNEVGASASDPNSYGIGEKVEILYSLKDPSEIRENTFFSLWAVPFFLSIFGGLFFLIILCLKKMKVL